MSDTKQESAELKEIKSELRLMGDNHLIAIGACKSGDEVVACIGKAMFKLNEFAEKTFVAEEPVKPEPSRIIIP